MATKETQSQHDSTKAHIILFSSPGMGHLIPMLELAKQLASPTHDFTVTVITKATRTSLFVKDKESFLSSLSSSVNIIFLPSIDHRSLTSFEVTDVFRSTLRSLPDLREAIRSLKPLSSIVGLIADFLSVDAIAIAKEFFVPFHVFFPTNLMALSSLLECRKINHHATKVSRDRPCITLTFVEASQDRKNKASFNSKKMYMPRTDLGEASKEQKSEANKMSLYISKKIYEANGILCNSFSEMEQKLASLVMEDYPKLPPVYTIGPLVRSIPDQIVNVPVCIEWLNQQPSGSVLFVSFGSKGTLSSEQITELAWGLELSKHHFLWVIKNPGDLNDGTLLPKWFVERNKEVGLVIQSWVPQREVLGHNSIGGFLTHCGWNSVLESVMSGVPMIAWPLQAEQQTTANMLVKRIRVALRPHVQGRRGFSIGGLDLGAMLSNWMVHNDERQSSSFQEGVVPRDAIATIVKELMQREAGREARTRALELKASGERALAADGSSFKNLIEWKNSLSKYCLE